ncbi:MAG: phosphoenolpyruvate carboxykinase (GTP), partial [Candidatus Aminicenantes bacterium]|nr:phosphoenolpyruvate carboxykinase (GTP) [Candidatus Aminicenantes bacterium]
HRLTRPPKIFSVNWFRRDEHGNFLWPGFGDNMRVLKWIVDRAAGRAGARETPAGLVPRIEDLELYGLDMPRERLAKLFEVDMKDWRGEAADIKDSLKKYGRRLPREIWSEYEALERQTK